MAQQEFHMPIVCPECQMADMIRKVSSIVADGTFSGIHSRTDSGVGGLPSTGGTFFPRGNIPLQGTYQTELAKKLSPPSKPRVGCGWYLLPFIPVVNLVLVWFAPIAIKAKRYMVLFLVLYLFPLLTANYFFTLSSEIWLSLVILFLAIYVALFYTALKKDNDEKVLDWEEKISKWQQLYYCARNDCVFNPNTCISIPIENLDDLLI